MTDRRDGKEDTATRASAPELAEFEARLKAARREGPEGRAAARQSKRERSGGHNIAWRISTELVAAFMVCGFIGWWVDEWTGNRPLFMLIGLVLGGVVGIRNVFRVARNMPAMGGSEGADKTGDE